MSRLLEESAVVKKYDNCVFEVIVDMSGLPEGGDRRMRVSHRSPETHSRGYDKPSIRVSVGGARAVTTFWVSTSRTDAGESKTP